VVTAVSPTSQHFYGGGGNGSAVISAPSATSWSATASATWIFISSSSSGTGPQTLQYGVTANTAGAAARSGTITVSFSTGQNATLSINEDALSSALPTVTLLNPPPNGAYPNLSTQQTFTFQASSPNGSAYISSMDLMINNSFYADGDYCDAIYVPSANIMYFFQPNGSEQGYTLGSSGTASNYHCIINLSSSSATITDTSVTVTLVVSLQPSAVGTQNVYLDAWDNSYAHYATGANYGVSFGTWLAYNELTTNPPTISMVSPVTSATSQILYFKLSDGNGYRYIDGNQQVMLAYDSGLQNAPCMLFVTFDLPPAYGDVNQSVNGVRTELGQGTIGSGGVISGASCTIDLTNSKVHVNPNPALPDPDPNASVVTDLYLDLSVTLASTTPPVNIYALLSDRAGRGGMVLVTQWP
jgi:Viral BACON domain